MKYRHMCSLEWLEARQSVLTATDVKDLLPFTRTGRPRKVTESDYLKVLARKICDLSEEDCESTGAMARGHILEPYAVDMYNQVFAKETGDTLFHWDDVVVRQQGRGHLGLGFSPDACDKALFSTGSAMLKVPSTFHVHAVGEVKSYNPSAHLIAGATPKEELEERWQVAAAMAALESIERAHLIFFNPSLREQAMFLATYERGDLHDEIEAVLEVERNWLDFVDNWDYDSAPNKSSMRTVTEAEIVERETAKARLNP